jgi:hypothetical protein
MSEPLNESPVTPHPAEEPVTSLPTTGSVAFVPAQVAPVPVQSAPPFYAAPPVYSTPPMAGVPAPEPAKTNKTALIFGILALVFFLGAGSLGGLYFLNKTDSDKTISDQKTKIAALETEVKAKDADLTKAKNDLATASSDLITSKANEQKLIGCKTAANDFFNAIKNNDDKGAQKALIDLTVKCDVSIT